MRDFLGPTGSATLVLLKIKDGSPRPKETDVRRLFGIDSLKFYKGDGWYKDGMRVLERLLNILSGIKGNTPPWKTNFPSDYLLLPYGTKQHIFFTLTYSSILLDGFDLNHQCMHDLRDLLEFHDEVCKWRSHVQAFPDYIEFQSKNATEYNVTDATVLKPDLLGIRKILAGYGDSAIDDANVRLLQWHAMHKWKSEDSPSI